jgi:hypothetical protein
MKLNVLVSFIPAAVFVPTVLTVFFLRQKEKWQRRRFRQSQIAAINQPTALVVTEQSSSPEPISGGYAAELAAALADLSLYERITETEFNEMMTHGPKIRSDLVEIRVRNIKTSPGGSHFSMDGVKSDHLSSAYRVPLQFNGQSPRSSLQSRRYIFSPM